MLNEKMQKSSSIPLSQPGGSQMNTIGNIIVGLWLIPVTLFIFVPLALLGADLLVSAFKKITGKVGEGTEQQHAVGQRV